MLLSDQWPSTTAPPHLQNNPSRSDLQVPGERKKNISLHTPQPIPGVSMATVRTSQHPGKGTTTRLSPANEQPQYQGGTSSNTKFFSTSASGLLWRTKHKVEEEPSAPPECFVNLKFSSAVGTERNETRVVSFHHEDIEGSPYTHPDDLNFSAWLEWNADMDEAETGVLAHFAVGVPDEA